MKEFENYLKKCNLSKKTISSYVYTMGLYYSEFDTLSKSGLLEFKNKLLEDYNARTVNIRILAINKYLKFVGKNDLKLNLVKIQQKTFLDNIISNADYNYFKNQLKKDGHMDWYFVIRYLTATGARISELIQLKIEHVHAGFYDIYSKGGKIRRLYIPQKLKTETLQWVNGKNRESGFLFLNRYNKRITTRGIAYQLKKFAKKYKINENVVYPHSFRHLFAKNFLEKYNDLPFLADLMGHENIETTRVYLRKTATEQKEIVDKVVTW